MKPPRFTHKPHNRTLTRPELKEYIRSLALPKSQCMFNLRMEGLEDREEEDETLWT